MPRRSTASRAPGIDSGDLARGQRDERVARPSRSVASRRSTPARDATPFAERLPLVEDPLHRPARQADEHVVHDLPVVPEIHRDDRLRRPCAIALSDRRATSADRSPSKSVADREPRHGRDHVGGVDRLAAHVDGGDPSTAELTRASACTRTSPPWLSMYRLRWHRVHLVERRHGQSQRRVRRLRPNISASTRTNGAAAASDGGWFSAATASGSQSHSRRRPLLADERSSQRGQRSPAGHRRAAPSSRPQHRPTDAKHLEAVAPFERLPLEHRRRAGAAAAADSDTSAPSRLPVASRYGTRSDGCTRTFAAAPIRRSNRKRLAITAEEHVLAVVDPLAGDAVDERRRAAAELTAGLEDDARAGPPRRARSRPPDPATPPPITATSNRRGRWDIVMAIGCSASPPQRRAPACAATRVRRSARARGRGTRITRLNTS